MIAGKGSGDLQAAISRSLPVSNLTNALRFARETFARMVRHDSHFNHPSDVTAPQTLHLGVSGATSGGSRQSPFSLLTLSQSILNCRSGIAPFCHRDLDRDPSSLLPESPKPWSIRGRIDRACLRESRPANSPQAASGVLASFTAVARTLVLADSASPSLLQTLHMRVAILLELNDLVFGVSTLERGHDSSHELG